MDDPQITVVMPCYQQARFVEAAVRSVLGQEGVAVELIVSDPGSTDGTRDILARLEAELGPRLRIVLERDDGQSDAINRGMQLARGDVLGWLNSDDLMRDGTLRTAVDALAGRDEPAWLYGRAGMIDAENRPVTPWISGYKGWRGRRFSRFKLLTENFIAQMAVFWNRAMWTRAGPLDVARHLDMDYDLWLRFAAIAEPTVVRDTLAEFRVHSEAKGSRQTKQQLDAALCTAREHARALGWRGRLALALHRLYSLRTRLAYTVVKP